jgi:hypothetical protein
MEWETQLCNKRNSNKHPNPPQITNPPTHILTPPPLQTQIRTVTITGARSIIYPPLNPCHLCGGNCRWGRAAMLNAWPARTAALLRNKYRLYYFVYMVAMALIGGGIISGVDDLPFVDGLFLSTSAVTCTGTPSPPTPLAPPPATCAAHHVTNSN